MKSKTIAAINSKNSTALNSPPPAVLKRVERRSDKAKHTIFIKITIFIINMLYLLKLQYFVIF